MGTFSTKEKVYASMSNSEITSSEVPDDLLAFTVHRAVHANEPIREAIIEDWLNDGKFVLNKIYTKAQSTSLPKTESRKELLNVDDTGLEAFLREYWSDPSLVIQESYFDFDQPQWVLAHKLYTDYGYDWVDESLTLPTALQTGVTDQVAVITDAHTLAIPDALTAWFTALPTQSPYQSEYFTLVDGEPSVLVRTWYEFTYSNPTSTAPATVHTTDPRYVSYAEVRDDKLICRGFDVTINANLEVTTSSLFKADYEWVKKYETIVNGEPSGVVSVLDSATEQQLVHTDIQTHTEALPLVHQILVDVANNDNMIYALCTSENTANSVFLYNARTDTYLPQSIISFPGEAWEDAWMPVIPAWSNNKNVIAQGLLTTQQVEDANELMEPYNVSLNQICDLINDNESVGDIDYAYVAWGVRLSNEDQAAMRYMCDLFEFLDDSFNEYNVQEFAQNLRDQQFQSVIEAPILPTQENPLAQALTNARIHGPQNQNILWTNIYGDNTPYRMAVRWDAITRYIRTGRIGPVGFVKRDWTEDRVRFLRQINETQFKEIIVWNLKQQAGINEYYDNGTLRIIHGAYSELKHANLPAAEYAYGAENKPEDNGYEIHLPLNINLVNAMDANDRNDLFYSSLHLQIASYQRVKIKWYEHGFGKVLVFVAALAIGIYLSPEMSAALVAAAAAGTYALTLFILEQIFIYLLVQAATKIVIRIVGIEIAFLIAIAAFLYGGYLFVKDGFTVVAKSAADYLLKAAVALSSGIQTQLGQDVLDLEREYGNFLEDKEEKLELLESAQDDLAGAGLLDPMSYVNILTPTWLPNESPSQFFYRSIHTGNPGVLSYDLIENYHSISLTLPDPTYV